MIFAKDVTKDTLWIRLCTGCWHDHHGQREEWSLILGMNDHTTGFDHLAVLDGERWKRTTSELSMTTIKLQVTCRFECVCCVMSFGFQQVRLCEPNWHHAEVVPFRLRASSSWCARRFNARIRERRRLKTLRTPQDFRMSATAVQALSSNQEFQIWLIEVNLQPIRNAP